MSITNTKYVFVDDATRELRAWQIYAVGGPGVPVGQGTRCGMLSPCACAPSP